MISTLRQRRKTRVGFPKLIYFLLPLVCGAFHAQADNLFVTDLGSGGQGNIYELNTSGGLGQVLSTPLVTGLDDPLSLTVDGSGNLFAYSHGNIYEINPANGHGQTLGTPLVTGLPQIAQSMTVSSSGNLFAGAGGIYRFNPANGYGQTPGIPFVSQSASFGGPLYGMAFDSHGNLFASGIGRLYEIAPDGSTSIFSQAGITPFSMAFDNNGDLFGAVQSNGNIYEYVNNGGVLSSTPVFFAGNVAGVSGLAFDSANNLYAVDNGNGTIVEFDPHGNRSVLATGGTDLYAIAIEPVPVPEPSALALLASGTLLGVRFLSGGKCRTF